MNCVLCSETNVPSDHESSEKHIRNKKLSEYSLFKNKNYANKNDTFVSCDVISKTSSLTKCLETKIKISVKPNEEVSFYFRILNDSKNKKILINFVQIMHSKLYFTLNNHGFVEGSLPHVIMPKSELDKEIKVVFKAASVGEYLMPIIFCFTKNKKKENFAIIRDMIVYVEETKTSHNKIISPFGLKNVVANVKYKSTNIWRHTGDIFTVPKNYKNIFYHKVKYHKSMNERDRELVDQLSNVFETGVTKKNYMHFFHALLWYEETELRSNLKRYNMSGVTIEIGEELGVSSYILKVPGLEEKRPSLLLGDILFIKPEDQDAMFGAQIVKIHEDTVTIKNINELFPSYYDKNKKYDVTFTLSRITVERMHRAVHSTAGLDARLFPVKSELKKKIKSITEFFNPLIAANPEQRSAVEHIVCRSSGLAPYLVHGPPGTGKTVTIVEAILQVISTKPTSRILVCTDSNMAADHVATLLVQYADQFPKNFLKRPNSKHRPWDILPKCLVPYSNGSGMYSFRPVSLDEIMGYMIVVTTLSHAAKFSSDRLNKNHITHLFIDEAAQASEPAALIPLCGLLAPRGAVVLAGDPLQLGPVVMSDTVKKLGLGLSLMGRLMKSFPQYDDTKNDPNYMVLLRNNFRSNPDILSIPNELFYKGLLRAFAKNDPLSNVDILGKTANSRAITFHGVLSKEGKLGLSPSYFNKMELEVVQMYIKLLVKDHNVKLEDIGVIAPYIRQVIHIKRWLAENKYEKIEVGTVEAFQGKEKRVIIISTVRANSNLFEPDISFKLGFLVDEKRFNVALTRAKAKLIIIGNPVCLQQDKNWNKYIQLCRELGTYRGFDTNTVTIDDEINKMIDKIIPMLKHLND